MQDKSAKIHALGVKKLSQTGRAFYQTNVQSSTPVNKPPIIVKPIPQPQIRYIMVQHPQFDTLMKEFRALRAMYDQLLVKFQQKNTQESLRANIQEVIQSTHDIEAKMSRIVEDANNASQKQNQPNIESERERHEKQCLQIIETVNRATEKIQELQNKNKDLKNQIQNQKQWKEALQKQNKRLRQMYQTMENQKSVEIENLKRQIKLIKQSQQKQQNDQKQQQQEKGKQEKLSFVKQKIDNSQYLAQSQISNEQISGFSKLSINVETTRKSRIYE